MNSSLGRRHFRHFGSCVVRLSSVMRSISLLLVALVLGAAFQVDAYSLKYKAKRLGQLLGQAKQQNVLELDSTLFEVFTDKPRNYSIIVLFTADDPSMGCEPCSVFDPVAASHDSLTDPRLLLGRADFSQAREAFAKMKLESAPVVMHFPPTEGALAGADASIDRYQIQFDPEHFAGWVSQSTQIPVRWVKPINYEQLVFNLTVLLLVLAVGKLVYSNFSGRFLQNPHIWAVVTLVFIIHMNSGYMWNQIRHAPYSGQTRQGKIELISGNFQSQYVIETQIITVLYAGCAAAFIWLVQRVPKFESENAQRYALYVGMAMFVGLYSLLINVFRIKNGGYPFRLLL